MGTDELEQQLWRERSHVIPSSPSGRAGPDQHGAEGHATQRLLNETVTEWHSQHTPTGQMSGENERREGERSRMGWRDEEGYIHNIVS